MSERSINAAIFGGSAALVSFVLVFLILKIFKVKTPFENKLFPYMLGGFMLLCYVARVAIR